MPNRRPSNSLGFDVKNLLLKSSVVLLGKEAHEMRRFHLMDWPEHGVPESAAPILDLLVHAHKHMDIDRIGPLTKADEATSALAFGSLKIAPKVRGNVAASLFLMRLKSRFLIPS